MNKLLKIKKITNNKWLNLYDAEYHCDSGDTITYHFASRRKMKDISLNDNKKVDAVRILPYLIENNKKYVVLIKEFRYVINDYIYSTPAGLIDANETPETAAKREIEEEIGASVVSIKETLKSSYTSVGLTDETIACFEAQVKLNKTQHLDRNEEITYFKLPFDDLLEFIENNNLDFQSAVLLKSFYYQNKFLELKNEK